jgi:hypothetical protein
MNSMALCKIVDQILNWSGVVPPPGKRPPPTPSLFSESVNDPPRISQPPAIPARENMVNITIGNLPSLNGSAWVTAGLLPWATKTRPLSDIRELTEPSLVEVAPRKLPPENTACKPPLSRNRSVASNRRPSVDSHLAENRGPGKKDTENRISGSRGRDSATPSPPSLANNTYSRIYSIPRSNIPRRSSSQLGARSASRPRVPPPVPPPPLPLASIPTPTIPPPPPRGSGNTIPRRGQSLSPLRQVAARLDPATSNRSRRVPSRTFIREPLIGDILEFPTHRHPRVDLELILAAGLFVRGGSIEGTAQISIDDADRIRHKRTLDIASISVDLIGLEEMTGSKKSVFLNLAAELIGSENPPPYNMVESQDQISLSDPF